MASWFRLLRRDLSPSLTEGFAERLQGTYTMTLYFVAAAWMLWGFTGFSSNQIACWTPNHLTGSQGDYVYKTCWMKNIHWLPINNTSTLRDLELETNRMPIFNVGKYSPFIAISLAVLLLLPKVLCRYTSAKFGTSVKNILDLTSGSNIEKKDAEIAKAVAEYLQERPNGFYFTIMYVIVKLVYLVIALTQLVLIDMLLDIRCTDFVSGLVNSIKTNTDMVSSGRFPDEILCDFTIRRLGNFHRYVVQCSMPGNRVYEKMWVLFLFWVIAMTITAIVSLTKFMAMLFVQKYRFMFISHRLAMKGKIQNTTDAQAWFFVQSYLGRDGFLISKLMSENIGEGLAADVIERLWLLFRDGASKNNMETESLTRNHPI